MTYDFIFPDNNTISDWVTIQKQVAKNGLEQQAQQVDPDRTTEHCNYNSEITLLLFLDSMHHKTWSIDRARSLAGTDPTEKRPSELYIIKDSVSSISSFVDLSRLCIADISFKTG